MQKNGHIKIEVNLTEDIFRRFTLFDTLKRRKMWRSPATFTAIPSTCVIICFIMRHVDGAVFLGCTLLLVGLGMPLAYFISLFSSIRKQIIDNGLKRPQHVYTLDLTEKANGISISNKKEHVDYKWKDVHHVYRDTLATYLFMTAQRGFILPCTCIEKGDDDDLWNLIAKKVPQERCTDLRK